MKASEVVERLQQVYPGQPEYIQAVSQVLGTIEDEYNKHLYHSSGDSGSVDGLRVKGI